MYHTSKIRWINIRIVLQGIDNSSKYVAHIKRTFIPFEHKHIYKDKIKNNNKEGEKERREENTNLRYT